MAALTGAALLLLKHANTAAYDWEPLEVPIAASAGEPRSGSFVAADTLAHDVLLIVDSTLPEEELEALLGRASAERLSVTWALSKDADPIARGSAQTAFYTSTGGRTVLGQLRRYLLGIPFHRDGGSFARAIGRVRTLAAERYTLTVFQQSLPVELVDARPRVGLRVGREVWERHTKGMAGVAYTGLGLIALSGLLFALWLLAWLRRASASR